MKTILILVGLPLFGGLCWWALSGHSANRSQAAVKLTSDNINIFDSVALLKRRYPFIDQEFVGSSLNRLPSQLKTGVYGLGQSGDNDSKPTGMEYFIRIKFVPIKPQVAMDYVRINELNKVREAHGRKIFDQRAVEQVKLYTLKAEIQIGMDAQEAKPDVWAYNDAADEWKGFFVELNERIGLKLIPDSGDPHRFDINGSTFQFNEDFTQITSTGRIKSSLTRVDKLPPINDMAGYRHVTLKLAATTSSNSEFLFREYSRNAMIIRQVPIYFKPDGKGTLGKVLFSSQTYPLNGFKDANGTLKIFTTMHLHDTVNGDAFLQWNPGRTVISVLPYHSATAVDYYNTYQTVTVEKVDLKGKDAEMAANYDSLGSIPETIQSVPQVWNYYDLNPQPVITAADAAQDPSLSQIFNLTPNRAASNPSSSPSLFPAIPREAARPASTSGSRSFARKPGYEPPQVAEGGLRLAVPQAKVPPPTVVKQPEAAHLTTEQELEQRMQEAYRKRRRGY